MYRFYLAAVDLLPAALLLIPFYWIVNRVYFRNGKKSAYYCMISCYLGVIYVLTGLPTVAYIEPELNLNLIPILPMAADLKNSALNIFLFVPLGMMLPLGWRKFREKYYVVGFGFGVSLCIEILQIFTFRATDVNDLITNTIGAYLGCLPVMAIMKKNPRIATLIDEENSHEIVAVLLTTCGIMFFLYPFASGILWDLILTK